MSDKVVALPGAKLADGSVPKNIVEAIEEVLVEARAGRVGAVGICWAMPDGSVNSVIAQSGLPLAHTFVAACAYLFDRAKEIVRG